MKARKSSSVRKSGVHKGNESQKELGCKKKKVFIEGMKARKSLAVRKSGVHKENESQKELGCKKKWYS